LAGHAVQVDEELTNVYPGKAAVAAVALVQTEHPVEQAVHLYVVVVPEVLELKKNPALQVKGAVDEHVIAFVSIVEHARHHPPA